MSEFENMSGPELVRAFNEMANSAIGQELRARPVTRFADTESGRKRCSALAGSIKAREQGLGREDSGCALKKPVAAATLESSPGLRRSPPRSGDVQSQQQDRTAQSAIMQQFKTKPHKLRGKLLARLHASIGTPVSVPVLVRAVYGNGSGNAGALKMVLRGLQLSIKKDNLPYELLKSKVEGEISYGLFNKA